MNLLADDSFRPAGSIDDEVRPNPGVYAIRVRVGSTMPEPFKSLLSLRSTRLIYVGKATSLKGRMLDNELRGRGHGTFFRSIGAVLGYRPAVGSLSTKVNKYNFSFQKSDRAAIVGWVNASLDVSWEGLPLDELRATEAALIAAHMPLLNIDGKPSALSELDELRLLCRQIASGTAAAL